MNELLSELRRRDIALWRDGDSLRFNAPAGALTPELRAELSAHKEELLAELSLESVPDGPRPRTDPDVEIPLTFAQEGLWIIDQMDPGLATYHCELRWRITGPLDGPALERSLTEITRRHEILRTRIDRGTAGKPVQIVQPPASFPLSIAAVKSADAAAEAHFDLEHGPLWNAVLTQFAAEDHELFLTWHHLVFDAWSESVFTRELAALYAAYREGRPNPLPALPIQFGDFALWQRRSFAEESVQSQLDYWQKRLAGDHPPLALPGDRPRPTRQTYRGATRTRELPSETAAGLRHLARQEGVTMFVLLLAAFKALLARYTGEADICVGSPFAQRNSIETESLIGFFLNMLALRTDLSGDPGFRELLGRVRGTVLEGFEHQDVPFEKVVEALHPARVLSHHPLFQIAFVCVPEDAAPPSLPGLAVERVAVPVTTSKFDLTLFARESADGIGLKMEYSTDQFEAGTIDRMLASFDLLVQGIVAEPTTPLSRLPIIDAAERQRLLVEWNATAAPFPKETVHEIIAQQAARTPDRPALECTGKTLTYAELDRAASAVAAHLQTRGVERGQLIGICLERSVEMLVTVLGVLKTGAAYVPLDPAFPAARLAMMIEDAALPIILTHAATRTLLPDFAARMVEIEALALPAATPRPVAVEPGDRAYVLFTSGSTGRPRGVEIPHRALANFLASMQAQPGLGTDDILLAVTTLSFDIAALELFLPLVVGAKVVIATTDIARDAHLLAAELERSRATVLQATPATWRALLLAGWRGRTGLKALVGGEAMPADLLADLLPRVGELWNMYGPTETTIWSTVERLSTAALPVSIGRPIANTTAYIVDAQLQPVPVGVAGELLLGGAGLALGYLGQPELTAERFIPHPFEPADGHRVYRTGDRARFLPDGRIECLGRLDQQTKLRGFRIELGEIESCLNRDERVAESAVLVREDRAGDRRLVAYIVPAAAHPFSPELAAQLRKALQTVLPEYMVPSALVALPALPLTPNGKIDRRALPPPGEAELLSSYAPPENTLHAQLIEIWEQLLDRRPIGIRDHFFELGGHSLLAAQMLAAIEERLGHRVTFAALFEEPTVAHIAACIFASQQKSAAEAPMVAFHADAPKRPFFFLHGDYIGGGFFSQTLAQQVGDERPFYAIHPHGLHGDPAPPTFEEMAAAHLVEIRRIQPHGPYLLGGYCNGAMIAFEIARRLKSEGESVSALVLLMAYGSNASYAWLQKAARLPGGGGAAQQQRYLRWLGRWHFFNGMRRKYSESIRDWLKQPTGEQMQRLGRKTRHVLQRIGIPAGLPPPSPPPPGVPQSAVAATYAQAFAAYVPGKYHGPAVLLWPIDEPAPAPGGPATGWADVCHAVEVVNVPGEHHSCVSRHAHLVVIGDRIREALLRAEASPPSPAASRQLVTS